MRSHDLVAPLAALRVAGEGGRRATSGWPTASQNRFQIASLPRPERHRLVGGLEHLVDRDHAVASAAIGALSSPEPR